MVEKEQIIEVLKKVVDPEINYDVWSLGLIYNIGIEGSKVKILMTFTTPMCPYGPQLLDDVRRHVSSVSGVGEVDVEITFTPVWGPDKISEEVRMALGI
jgi:metal-sulfur cluster biosynthetic enzyme